MNVKVTNYNVPVKFKHKRGQLLREFIEKTHILVGGSINDYTVNRVIKQFQN